MNDLNDKGLISVIVPVYRVEKYLDRCIESIVDQTYTNLDIILVDDGSPDKCPVICDQWALKDSRIKVIHKKNGGLSDARNAGMKVAKGEFIGFVDSDDWIAPEMYQKLLDSIINVGSDISACSVEMVWEDSAPKKMLTKQINKTLNKVDAQRELLHESDLLQPVWYKLYKRELIKDILFEVGKQHEDVFWSYQAIGKAERVSIIDYIGYYYLQRSESIMGQKYSLKRLNVMDAICQRQEYFASAFPELLGEGVISIWGTCLYHGQQILINLGDSKQINELFIEFRKIMKRYPMKRKYFRNIKFTHKIWFILEGISLKATCVLRNQLKIGF